MTTVNSTTGRSKPILWTGRVITGLIVLFMLFDGVTKIMKVQPVVEATRRLGYPENTIVGIGIVATVSTILYLIPQTAVLGAILLTGFLGGALATQVRAGEPIFNWIFAVAFGVLTWLGVYLRDPRLRSLLPLRAASVKVRSTR
jgi:DoxX-like family